MIAAERMPGLLRLVRFVLVGGLNSVLHAVVVLALGQVLPTVAGFVLIMIGWAICIPIGYLTQARFVWNARLTWRGLLKIAVSQIPSVAISTLLGALGGVLGFPLIAQEGMALVSGAVLSYVMQRFWVFAPKGESGSAASSAEPDVEVEKTQSGLRDPNGERR